MHESQLSPRRKKRLWLINPQAYVKAADQSVSPGLHCISLWLQQLGCHRGNVKKEMATFSALLSACIQHNRRPTTTSVLTIHECHFLLTPPRSSRRFANMRFVGLRGPTKRRNIAQEQVPAITVSAYRPSCKHLQPSWNIVNRRVHEDGRDISWTDKLGLADCGGVPSQWSCREYCYEPP